MLTIILMGGGNWTVPLPGFVAELVACAVITSALASRDSIIPRSLVAADLLIMALLGLCFAQLVPLAPALWAGLPGRETPFAIMIAAFGMPGWRPISLDPSATLASLAAFLPAISIYIAVRTAPAARIEAILNAIPIGLVASASIAFAQLAFRDLDWIRLFPVGDYQYPIGFFANHNHQATFLTCSLPLLAFWLGRIDAASARAKLRGVSKDTVLLVAAGLISALCLVTGSRTGVVLLVVSLAGTSFAWQRQSPEAGSQWIMRSLLPIGLIVTCIWLMITQGADRLAAPFMRNSMAGDQRWGSWYDAIATIKDFWPVGSGIGTFTDAFAIHEPLSSVSERFLNHAHNDYFEVALEAGLPGVLLLCCAVWITIGSARRALRVAETNIARMEVVLALLPSVLIGLHSFTDYPVRTHAISAILLMCWALSANSITRSAQTDI